MSPGRMVMVCVPRGGIVNDVGVTVKNVALRVSVTDAGLEPALPRTKLSLSVGPLMSCMMPVGGRTTPTRDACWATAAADTASVRARTTGLDMYGNHSRR